MLETGCGDRVVRLAIQVRAVGDALSAFARAISYNIAAAIILFRPLLRRILAFL